MLIRNADARDLPAILEIERASSAAAHWSETVYQQALTPGSDAPSRVCLIAEHEGRVAGFLVAVTAGEEWELENIAVTPPVRRHGVGRALMKALVARAQDAGAREIRQQIRASNRPARSLGQSYGFLQQGRRPNYYQDPIEDALLLKFILPKSSKL